MNEVHENTQECSFRKEFILLWIIKFVPGPQLNEIAGKYFQSEFLFALDKSQSRGTVRLFGKKVDSSFFVNIIWNSIIYKIYV